MKNRVRRCGAYLKRVYTEPWTVRSAKINTAVWSIASLVGVANFGLGIMSPTSLKWLWLVVNLIVMLFDFTMLKWSATGLLWRKAQDEALAQKQRDNEAFYAMVMNEYKLP